MCFYPKIDLAKNIFVSFDNFLTDENVETNGDGKCQQNPGQEKTWPEAQPEAPANSRKNRYKIQNNNARAASGARPIFGVVVLNFESVF